MLLSPNTTHFLYPHKIDLTYSDWHTTLLEKHSTSCTCQLWLFCSALANSSIAKIRSNSASLNKSHRCMLNTIDGPSESVEDYLCDPEEMPLGARESRLPCPEDCVLNDWGPWSRCSLVRAEPRSESSSSAIWHTVDMGASDFSKAHWDLSWYLFLVRNIFFSEARGIQSVAALYYSEQCMNLCQQVISRPPRRNKRDIWTRKQEKNCLYITYITLYSLCIQQGRKMIYDEDSGGVQIYIFWHTHSNCLYISSGVQKLAKSWLRMRSSFGSQPWGWK